GRSRPGRRAALLAKAREPLRWLRAEKELKMESGKLKMQSGSRTIIHYPLFIIHCSRTAQPHPHKKTGSPERLPISIALPARKPE
ncbi:hypothetical protein, partial [uncultured Alistipes sp.]|uniref:hypothetical protein n=1 Tax=uncultured Alistipes sp. TaxID=538949 RepID=UPI002614BEDE